MMLAYRLVPLIEAHSDALANSLLGRAQHSSSTHSYQKVPPEELRERVHAIDPRRGEWRLRKVEPFFDWAIYFSTPGHDEARVAEQAATSRH
jgi:hypothetical protein